MSFHQQLGKIRKAHGCPRPDDLARKIGVKPALVESWERGASFPEARHWIDIVESIPEMLAIESWLRAGTQASANRLRAERAAEAAKYQPLHTFIEQVKAAQTFGAALRLCREREGITLAALAGVLGCHHSSVGHWELNEFQPIAQHRDALLTRYPDLSLAPPPASRAIAKSTGVAAIDLDELRDHELTPTEAHLLALVERERQQRADLAAKKDARIASLEQTNDAQAHEIVALKRRLEEASKPVRVRNHLRALPGDGRQDGAPVSSPASTPTPSAKMIDADAAGDIAFDFADAVSEARANPQTCDTTVRILRAAHSLNLKIPKLLERLGSPLVVAAAE